MKKIRPFLGTFVVLALHVGLNLAGYHLAGYLFLLVTAMVFTYDSI